MALCALRVSLDLLRLVAESYAVWDSEEGYDAAVALVFWHAGMWRHALDLQYLEFCGGCTVEAALGAPVLGILGDRLIAWKAIALAWAAATVAVGFVAADRQAGRGAAWAFAALLAVPPPGVGALGLRMWGNHSETGLLVVGMLALLGAGRPFLLGLLAGFSVWFCRTSIYGVLAIVPLALLQAGRVRVMAGLLIGLSLLLLPAAAGNRGTYEMGIAANLLPHGIGAAWPRLVELVAPMRLGAELLGGPIGAALDPPSKGAATPAAGALFLAGAAMGAGALIVRLRGGVGRAAILLLPLAYAAGYAATSFDPARDDRGLAADRYLAPWLLLLPLLCSAGLGPALERRRLLARIGLAAPLLVGVVGQAAVIANWRPDPTALRAPAADPSFFATVWAPRFPNLALPAAGDPAVEANLRRIEGRRLADLVAFGTAEWEEVLPRAAVAPGAAPRLFGFGQALGERGPDLVVPVAGDLGSLDPAVATPLGRGLAAGLFGHRDLPPKREAEMLGGFASPQRCGLCALAGFQAAWSCGTMLPAFPPDFGPCVEAEVALAPDPREAMVGAGIAAWKPDRPPGALAAAAETIADPAQRAAFTEGFESPLARLAWRLHGPRATRRR